MSDRRKEFEAWCLTGKPADAWTNWQLCWAAARRSTLEEAAKVCEDLHEEDRPGDYAYAVRSLAGKQEDGK